MALTNQQEALVSGLGYWVQKFMEGETALREINRVIDNRDYGAAGVTNQDLVDAGFDFSLADIGNALSVVDQIETLLDSVLVNGRTGYEILDTVRLYQY